MHLRVQVDLDAPGALAAVDALALVGHDVGEAAEGPGQGGQEKEQEKKKFWRGGDKGFLPIYESMFVFVLQHIESNSNSKKKGKVYLKIRHIIPGGLPLIFAAKGLLSYFLDGRKDSLKPRAAGKADSHYRPFIS